MAAKVTWTEEITEQFESVSCGECGVRWAMTAAFIAQRRRDERGFYCPNGHSRYYPKQSEEQKLKDELERQRQALANEREHAARLSTNLKTERRQHAATKGQLTKTRNRIASGQCPHCGKRFPKLEHHMVTAHPDEVGSARDALLEETPGGAS